MVRAVKFRVQGSPSDAACDHALPQMCQEYWETLSWETSQANRTDRCRGEARSEGGPPGGGDISKQPIKDVLPQGDPLMEVSEVCECEKDEEDKFRDHCWSAETRCESK